MLTTAPLATAHFRGFAGGELHKDTESLGPGQAAALPGLSPSASLSPLSALAEESSPVTLFSSFPGMSYLASWPHSGKSKAPDARISLSKSTKEHIVPLLSPNPSLLASSLHRFFVVVVWFLFCFCFCFF